MGRIKSDALTYKPVELTKTVRLTLEKCSWQVIFNVATRGVGVCEISVRSGLQRLSGSWTSLGCFRRPRGGHHTLHNMSSIVNVFVVSPDTRSERRFDLHIAVQQLKVLIFPLYHLTASRLMHRQNLSSSPGSRSKINVFLCKTTRARRPRSFWMTPNNWAFMD